LKRSEGRETVSGVVEWSLPNSAVRVPADKKTFSQNLRSFAEGIYNRLKEEPNGRVIAEGGYNLVAVLSVPKQVIYLSTIPIRVVRMPWLRTGRPKRPGLNVPLMANEMAKEKSPKQVPCGRRRYLHV
jgi:hypothetical protein